MRHFVKQAALCLLSLTACGGVQKQPNHKPDPSINDVTRCVQAGFAVCIKRKGGQYFGGTMLESYIPHHSCSDSNIQTVITTAGEIAAYCRQEPDISCRTLQKLGIPATCEQPRQQPADLTLPPPENTEPRRA